MSAMFDIGDQVVTEIVEGAIDEAGGSPRRWAVLLVLMLVGTLGVLWLAKRAATDDDVVAVPDAGGSG